MAVNFPDSPTTGDTVTVNGVQYEWNGTVWNRIESSPSFINSDTAPTNPGDGDLWFNTDTLELFVWYVDGTSSQWVSVAGSATASWNNDGSNLYYDGVLNVGIGTSTPSEKLDVVGNISASGTINGVDMADVLVEVDTAVQLPTGTTAQRPGTPATGMLRYNTDDDIIESYKSGAWTNVGGGWIESSLTDATNGGANDQTLFDYTSIISNAKEIHIWIDDLETNAGDDIILQIGTGGSPTTTGYISNYALAGTTNKFTRTDGFIFGKATNDPDDGKYGLIQLYRISGNRWVESHTIRDNENGNVGVGGGVIDLAGALDIIRITTSGGTDLFNRGQIQVRYR